MFGGYLLLSKLEAIAHRFGVSAGYRLEWDGNRMVSEGTESLILTQQHPKELVMSIWGMIPAWSKQKVNYLMARAEGKKNPHDDPHFSGSKAIFMHPAFKRPLFTRRCAIIADAYVELDHVKQPWLVYLRERQRPFAMAGLYDIWIDPVTRAEHHSFALITVPGNALSRELSSTRMPVILPRGRETDWLKEHRSLTDILGMLRMYPVEKMNAYPVSPEILTANEIMPEMLKPIGDRLYHEQELKRLPQRFYLSRPRLIGKSGKV